MYLPHILDKLDIFNLKITKAFVFLDLTSFHNFVLYIILGRLYNNNIWFRKCGKFRYSIKTVNSSPAI